MRAKSFGAEKRQKQDQLATVTIVILAIVLLCSFIWSALRPYCVGALQGAWSPLLIMALRYGFRVISGKRRDLWALVHALAFVATTLYIAFVHYPHDVWHASIMFLCLISTILGVQRFRFTLLFMFFNCLVAGLVLLS